MPEPGTILTIYHGHAERVRAVAWSPDGTRIASGSTDRTVQIWHATTGQHMFTYRGHAVALLNFVEAVAWSPDGTRIASGNDDHEVHVWTTL
jgi:eukaryotic-like serine/threonine-protein kinase